MRLLSGRLPPGRYSKRRKTSRHTSCLEDRLVVQARGLPSPLAMSGRGPTYGRPPHGPNKKPSAPSRARGLDHNYCAGTSTSLERRGADHPYPQAGLLACGSSLSSAFPCLQKHSGQRLDRSPLTVAPPRRTCTGFPKSMTPEGEVILLLGQL